MIRQGCLLSTIKRAPGTNDRHITRMDGRRLVRHLLLNSIKTASESVFYDLINPDVNAAISLEHNRTEWEKNRPSEGC